MTYVAEKRFHSIVQVPLALPETALSRGQILQVAAIQIRTGDILRIAWLNLHLINILTPQVIPSIYSQKYGLVNACVSTSLATTGQGCNIGLNSPGTVALNPYYTVEYRSPGIYYVLVANNTSNIDASVVMTGMARVFRA